MSRHKKGHYRKCGRKKRKKCYKRNFVTRTTKCKGGCVPTTQDVLKASCSPGSVITQDRYGNLVGCGTTRVGAPACGVGAPATYYHLTSGAYPGSNGCHLHLDRYNNIYGHCHPGGELSHHHDADCQDVYVGQIGDVRSLTRDPDSLNRDVLGATTACGSDRDCPSGSECRGGLCRSPIIDQTRTVLGAGACDPGFGVGCARTLTSTNESSTALTSTLAGCGRIGGVRPHTGNLVGGFRDPAGCNNINSSSFRFTSASFGDGDTLSHCNLAYAAPGNYNTLPPQSLNTRAKTPDLRGFNNEGFSCIQGALCGSKRPTVCKTKIKEVYCC